MYYFVLLYDVVCIGAIVNKVYFLDAPFALLKFVLKTIKRKNAHTEECNMLLIMKIIRVTSKCNDNKFKIANGLRLLKYNKMFPKL